MKPQCWIFSCLVAKAGLWRQKIDEDLRYSTTDAFGQCCESQSTMWRSIISGTAPFEKNWDAILFINKWSWDELVGLRRLPTWGRPEIQERFSLLGRRIRGLVEGQRRQFGMHTQIHFSKAWMSIQVFMNGSQWQLIMVDGQVKSKRRFDWSKERTSLSKIVGMANNKIHDTYTTWHRTWVVKYLYRRELSLSLTKCDKGKMNEGGCCLPVLWSAQCL